MKLTATAFYSAVTDKRCSIDTALEAIRRWGVPFDENEIGHRKRGIDIVHLAAAQAKYAEEMAARAERKNAEATRKVARMVSNDVVVERLDRIIVLLDALYKVAIKT
jgi:hypothetical protein